MSFNELEKAFPRVSVNVPSPSSANLCFSSGPCVAVKAPSLSSASLCFSTSRAWTQLRPPSHPTPSSMIWLRTEVVAARKAAGSVRRSYAAATVPSRSEPAVAIRTIRGQWRSRDADRLPGPQTCTENGSGA